MKLQISTPALRSGIARVADTAKSGSTLPVLSNVLFEASEDILTLTASNLDQSSRISLPCNVKQPGRTTLLCTRLLKLISTLESDEVEVETNESETTTIKSGRNVSKILGLPADDFPVTIFVNEENARQWVYDPAELRSIFVRLAPLASTDAGRYILNGILMRSAGVLMKWVAADGRALGLIETDNDGPEADCILPNDFIRQAIKMLDEQTTVTLKLTDNSVSLIGDAGMLTSKLIEGSYPNYEAGIIQTTGPGIDLPREEFLRLINRVGQVGDDANKLCAVRLVGTKNDLEISAMNGALAESRESIGLKVKSPFQVTLNRRFMDAALRNLPDDTVQAWLSEDIGGAVFKAGNFLAVIKMIRQS